MPVAGRTSCAHVPRTDPGSSRPRDSANLPPDEVMGSAPATPLDPPGRTSTTRRCRKGTKQGVFRRKVLGVAYFLPYIAVADGFGPSINQRIRNHTHMAKKAKKAAKKAAPKKAAAKPAAPK